MKTYAVLDITDKTFYVGSTKSDTRPFEHVTKKGHENWRLRQAKAHNHEFFVFVSEDDGLGDKDRSEEQFYLDFYFGSPWCLNLNKRATGNPQAIDDYNGRVKNGEIPHSHLGRGDINTWMPEENKKRIENGTHNWLKENVDPHVECRRVESIRQANTGDGNPMRRPEVARKLSQKLKGRTWWVNEQGGIRFSFECPGENWQRGRKWKN